MRKGKYMKKTPVRQRLLTLIMCLSLILTLTVLAGTTLAWLTDMTDPLVSTFAVGTIKIQLSQTTEGFKLFPDESAEHDAKVTVAAGSEKCYVFVEIEAEGMTYVEGSAWKELENTKGVYYCIAEAAEGDQVIEVFQSVAAAEGDAHTLTVTAYACQYTKDNAECFTAAEAWAIVKPTTETP